MVYQASWYKSYSDALENLKRVDATHNDFSKAPYKKESCNSFVFSVETDLDFYGISAERKMELAVGRELVRVSALACYCHLRHHASSSPFSLPISDVLPLFLATVGIEKVLQIRSLIA